MKKVEMANAKDQITLKKYSLGLLISIVAILILTWANNDFSFTFFTNWKILLLIIIASFAFSLILIPFEISYWSSQTISMKKKMLISLIIFIGLFAFDLGCDYFGGNAFDWKSIIIDAIVAIFTAL